VDARLLQARRVLDHYSEWRRDHPDSPVIVLGDFNSLGNLWDFARPERAIQEMSSELEPSLREHRATLVGWPYQVDWIFSNGLKLSSSKVPGTALSDHHPVVADYRLD
jgi:endonuclease/exonuclease/phosphatase (EEP) superfamily protein YafD